MRTNELVTVPWQMFNAVEKCELVTCNSSIQPPVTLTLSLRRPLSSLLDRVNIGLGG